MKKIFSVIYILIFTISYGQVKPDFKKEVTDFFTIYENCFQLIGNTPRNEEEIKLAKKAFREVISSPYLRVPNDLNAAAKDSLLRLNQYLSYVEDNYPHGYEMKLNLSKMEFEDLHIDKSRNSYRVKATVTKRFVEPILSAVEGDSGQSSYDTSFVKKFTNLVFYFSTSNEFSKYTPLKLEAVQLAAKTPEYVQPLSELTAWLISLEEVWRKKLSEELKLPEVMFNRKIGVFSGIETTPDGEILSQENFTARKDEWLPSADDGAFVASLMHPEVRPGHYAGWIAPPKMGIDNQSGDFEFVRIQ